MRPSSTPDGPAPWFERPDPALLRTPAAGGAGGAASAGPPVWPDEPEAREFRTALRLQLVADDALDPAQGFRAGEAFAPGVRAVFALASPDGAEYVPDGLLERHGGAAALRTPALHNTLTRERSDACLAIRSDPDDNLPLGAFFQLTGRSHFVASLALDLVRCAREVGIQPGPDGLLFALPSRNLLLMHAIRDATCQDSMNALAMRAIRAHQRAPGAVTPNAFWWHDGRIEVISRYIDGRQVWSVPDELVGILTGHRRSERR